MDKHAEREIDLRKIFRIIKKKFWIVAVTAFIMAGLGTYYISQPQTALYGSSTRVFVMADSALFNAISVVIREPIVLNQVIANLKLNKSVEELASEVTVSSLNSSTVLQISVEDPNPFVAANVANNIVSSYQQVLKNTVLTATLIPLTKASANWYPVNNKSNRIVYIGLIVGALLGVGIIFVADSLNDTIKSEQDIEQLLGITLLGKVSQVKNSDIPKRKSKMKNVTLRGETVGS